MILQQPLLVANRLGQYDIVVTVDGGGLSGQAGAVRHGLSKALTYFEPELRPAPQEGRLPDPRQPRRRAQEVRPRQGPPQLPVLEAVGRRRVRELGGRLSASSAWHPAGKLSGERSGARQPGGLTQHCAGDLISAPLPQAPRDLLGAVGASGDPHGRQIRPSVPRTLLTSTRRLRMVLRLQGRPGRRRTSAYAERSPPAVSNSGVDTEEADAAYEDRSRIIQTWPGRARACRPSDRMFCECYRFLRLGGALVSRSVQTGSASKSIIAELLGKSDAVGIDCVAMNVNPLVCVGSRPLSLVDYVAVELVNRKDARSDRSESM